MAVSHGNWCALGIPNRAALGTSDVGLDAGIGLYHNSVATDYEVNPYLRSYAFDGGRLFASSDEYGVILVFTKRRLVVADQSRSFDTTGSAKAKERHGREGEKSWLAYPRVSAPAIVCRALTLGVRVSEE